jgi:hypothetical protein
MNHIVNFVEVPENLKKLGKFDIILITGPPGYDYENQ